MTKHSLCKHYKLSFIHFRLALPKAFKHFFPPFFVREKVWGQEREYGYKKLREAGRWMKSKKNAGLSDKMHTPKTRTRRKFFITFLPSNREALLLFKQIGCSSK